MTSRFDTDLTPDGRERTVRMIEQSEKVIELQRRDLPAMGLTADEVERAVDPLIGFATMLREDLSADANE